MTREASWDWSTAPTRSSTTTVAPRPGSVGAKLHKLEFQERAAVFFRDWRSATAIAEERIGLMRSHAPTLLMEPSGQRSSEGRV